MFTLYPQPPVFKALREYICAIQIRQGGDLQVGYKLGNYLSKAGFSNIVTKVQVVDARSRWEELSSFWVYFLLVVLIIAWLRISKP
ncbi:hypothetical protein NIES4102_04410 [Chondrocystis sp. NIES-4102]|nr:hypothetical protein NIES4102_04410 [Chondrocystis sp. NIES-4102]